MKRHAARNGFRVAAALVLLPAAIFALLRLRGPESPPNIVVIVMDTVRWDHLPCYGYDRNTAPNLTALIKSSRIYTNAYSVSSWTAPAHASLFTGLYPPSHRTTQQYWRMGDDLTTVAEILSEHGYRTIGLVGNPMLSSEFNFHQGFAEYFQTWKASPRRGEEHSIPARLETSLATLPPEKSVFVFINFIEPHSPYTSSGPFRNRFVSDPSIPITANDWTNHYTGSSVFSDAELRHLGELYDAEILYADHLVGRTIDILKANDRWENTVFVVTSDHGENIGDHGHMDHVFSLYESTIKIPLIVRYPKLVSSGSTDAEPTQLTDIPPTVMRMAGIGHKDLNLQGVDLLERGARKGRPIFCQYYRPKQALGLFPRQMVAEKLVPYDRHLDAVIFNGKKLILGSDGKNELYDLTSDPGETVNQIGVDEYNGHAQGLNELMKGLMVKYRPGSERENVVDEIQLDQETIEALKSLGYIN
jgi:arylsulfatase A-like enzyme